MRLWHIDLIPYLPKGQLVSQWRELNSIFKKQDNHILINYIYKYNKQPLLNYAQAVICEILNRGYKIRSMSNFNNYFKDTQSFGIERFKEHDFEYFMICYYNLKEKYLRGQKDFTFDVWAKLDEFYYKKLDEQHKRCING